MNNPAAHQAIKDLAPLSAISYVILVALAEQPLGHTQIQRQILDDSGDLYLTDSSLHRALYRLTREGYLIQSGPAYGHRYGLSEQGKRKLKAEVARYEHSVELAQERLA